MSPLSLPTRTPSATTAPAGTTPAKARLDSLTGLRWFAALLIFCYHFAYEEEGSGSARHLHELKGWTLAGPSAVSFFFILSGFVLAWSARSGDTVTGFWRRRFARIYPSHFVAFLIACAMLLWMGESLDPSTALANLTLTQSWVPDRNDVWFGYNGVSWSLSCEFLFYFSFPFVIPLIRRLKNAGLWATVVLGNVFVVLFPLLTGRIEHVTGWDAKFFLYIFPPVRLVEFVVGIALALLVKNGAWRGPGLLLSLALCLVGIFWGVHQVSYDFHWSAVTVVPYTLTVAAAARADLYGKPSVFRHRLLVYLGEVSFAFYLLHEMAVFTFNRIFEGQQPHLALHVGLVMAVSLVGAILLHEFVEKPGVKLLNPRRDNPGRKKS
ncbi:acyltransferase family protein [Streptomyces gamaensis]|uniref:Acyltransferase family protein n=1 Tax=Streptomyces gamaensis TaxID=1763542 RepID=A0ABW0ZAU6_9ACTN